MSEIPETYRANAIQTARCAVQAQHMFSVALARARGDVPAIVSNYVIPQATDLHPGPYQ